MSKLSVFKFNIGLGTSYSDINSIINNYLNDSSFIYDYNAQCYVVGEISEKKANEHMALEIVDALYDNAKGISHIYVNQNLHPCLNYRIDGNQLIIKAYILNDFANYKICIHSNVNTNAAGKEYYNDLKENLFDKLQQNNVNLISVETEKLKDGSSTKLLKKIIIIFLPIIVFFGLMALVSYLRTH